MIMLQCTFKSRISVLAAGLILKCSRLKSGRSFVLGCVAQPHQAEM